jgi:hypothetical protein
MAEVMEVEIRQSCGLTGVPISVLLSIAFVLIAPCV